MPILLARSSGKRTSFCTPSAVESDVEVRRHRKDLVDALGLDLGRREQLARRLEREGADAERGGGVLERLLDRAPLVAAVDVDGTGAHRHPRPSRRSPRGGRRGRRSAATSSRAACRTAGRRSGRAWSSGPPSARSTRSAAARRCPGSRSARRRPGGPFRTKILARSLRRSPELLERLLHAPRVDGAVVGADAHRVDRAPLPEVLDELVALVVLGDLEEDFPLVLGDDELGQLQEVAVLLGKRLGQRLHLASWRALASPEPAGTRWPRRRRALGDFGRGRGRGDGVAGRGRSAGALDGQRLGPGVGKSRETFGELVETLGRDRRRLAHRERDVGDAARLDPLDRCATTSQAASQVLGADVVRTEPAARRRRQAGGAPPTAGRPAGRCRDTRTGASSSRSGIAGYQSFRGAPEGGPVEEELRFPSGAPVPPVGARGSVQTSRIAEDVVAIPELLDDRNPVNDDDAAGVARQAVVIGGGRLAETLA